MEEKEGIDPGAAVTRCMFVNWGVLGAKPSSSARATHGLMTVLSLPRGPPSPPHTVLPLCSCDSFVCFETDMSVLAVVLLFLRIALTIQALAFL